MKTHQKSDPKMEPQSIKNHSKIRCGKKARKKMFRNLSFSSKPAPGAMRSGAGGYHFKRFPSEENKEESQLKGENKVECKKWSAKGTYRKASADREPTTHLNTLGGQRPRADIRSASAHSAGP